MGTGGAARRASGRRPARAGAGIPAVARLAKRPRSGGRCADPGRRACLRSRAVESKNEAHCNDGCHVARQRGLRAILAAEAGAFHRAFPAWGGDRHLGAAARREADADLGQTVVIENRGGAGGGVGAAEAARAAPDGYTLFFPSGSVVTANQHIYAKLNYDPEKDFVPVTNVVSGPQVLVVPAGSPYKSVRALVDAAKASPGRLTFGH